MNYVFEIRVLDLKWLKVNRTPFDKYTYRWEEEEEEEEEDNNDAV
jgi:hypothetical protein